MDPQAIVCGADDLLGIKAVYERCGVAIVRGGLDREPLDAMAAAVVRVIGARLRSLGRTGDASTLDAAYLALKSVDPALSRDLIVAARETLEFYRGITAPSLMRLVSALTPETSIQIVHDCCMMRVDGRDDGRNFAWHYDYAYNSMSQHAVTCWIPLTKVDPEMGNMRVVPGSHRAIRPVRLVKSLTGTAFAGPRKIELHDPDIEAFERDSIELPPVGPGDVVLLHAVALHRSGANGTDRARWIVNPRFSDLLDERVVSRGWNVSRAKNPYVFAEIHPEHVVE